MKTHKLISLFSCLVFVLISTNTFAQCVTNCPDNVTVGTDQNMCSAVVNYNPPTSNCTTTTVPPSGSVFPVGTTTVNAYDGCTEFFSSTLQNQLIHSTLSTPGAGLIISITGIIPGEFMSGVDFRPSNGQLYGLGVSPAGFAHIYTINPVTGSATVVGPGFPINPSPGSSYGFDFNPVVDRIRITSLNQNIRIDPNTGAIVAIDAPVNPPPFNQVLGLAYSNNFQGALNTTLYGLETNTSSLVMIGGMNGSPSPNTGIVNPVGPLGMPLVPGTVNGFDISSCDNSAYAVLQTGPQSSLYRINLITGAASLVGIIPIGVSLSGFSIAPSAPTCSFTVTVNDVQPPTVNCPGDLLVTNGPNQCGATVGFNVTASDNCSIQSLEVNPPSGSFFPNGTTLVTATATDVHNLTTTCTFNVIVNGNAPNLTLHGPALVCRGQTAVYCVDPHPGFQTVAWTLPTGATGTSTSNCITVTFNSKFNGGSICAAAVNPCGTGTPVCINVSLQTKPAKPDPIVGLSPVCVPSTAVYCIPAIANADSYIWNIGGTGPTAATIVNGQGTTCVTVNFPAGYAGNQELKVKASNCKGVGDEIKLALKVLLPPAMPGNITGPASVCKSQLGFYSIANVNTATSYLWTVTGNVWIAGGQGTTSLALDFLSSNSTSAVLSVTAQNACGVSQPRTKAIAINPACRLEGESMQNSTDELNATVFPNPTSGKVTVHFDMNENRMVNLRVFDLMGRVMYSKEISAIEGLNETDLDLTDLSKAVYILRLDDGQDVKTMRLTIN
jgi:hypothetical protein